MLLAGDVGGTKTILALYPADGHARAPAVQARYASRDFPSLTRILDTFLAEHPATIDAVCLAVAGPVVLNTHTALIGAARYGLELMADNPFSDPTHDYPR